MSRQARAFALFCATIGVVMAPAGVLAAVITQTSTLAPTTTDFSSNAVQVTPLSFQKFDTEGGSRVLDSVTLSFSAQVSNQFGMTFVNPATITDSVAGPNSSNPGPLVTLFEPDGVTPLITAQEPNNPTILSKSVTYGNTAGQTFPQSFSSSLPSTSPFYIAPTVVTASGTQTLNTAAELALFTKGTTGSNSISLPVSATAFSSFKSSSGNGFGSVSTQGTASVTVSYTWHDSTPAPETVPEPATVLIWGLGGASLLALRRLRRKAAAA